MAVARPLQFIAIRTPGNALLPGFGDAAIEFQEHVTIWGWPYLPGLMKPWLAVKGLDEEEPFSSPSRRLSAACSIQHRNNLF